MDQQLVIFNRKHQTPEDIYGRNQLDQDTTRYFPWVYDIAGGELGGQWWAVHLLEAWEQQPYYLAAPPKYNETYYQLKGKQRTAWLAALRRVSNGLFEGAILPDVDAEDDYYPLAVKLREDYDGLKENLANAIMRGLDKLEDWLSWREQSAATQLLTALSVVHLAVREGAVTLPLDVQSIEDERFKALLEDFQQGLVAKKSVKSSLRALHSQLTALSKLAHPVVPVSVGELPSVFPSLQWPKLTELLALPVSAGFWLDLKATLITRAERANKAVIIVGNALGITASPAQSSSEPQVKNKAELSYKQAAIFYYYTSQPITANNTSELAASLGYTSQSNGILLMRAYTNWCEQVASELPDNKRQLGALKKDLAIVLPHLTDKPYNEAFKLLKKVAKKYERGL